MSWTTYQYREALARLARSTKPIPASYVQVEREKDLHDAILAECRHRGWITIHARMDRPSTLEVGSPDFIILGSRGRVFIIEAKSKTGKLTKAQQILRAWAHKLGHEIVEVRSVAQFMHVIGKP